MYHALLTNRYLTSRTIPFIAVAAVALCTALVIIVVSVMSGFVDMVRSAGKTLVGDVVVSHPVRGLPHYERLVDAFQALPEAEAATPIIESVGLLRMPYDNTHFVMVLGVDPETFGDVTEYDDALVWETVPSEYERLLYNAMLARAWPQLVSMMTEAQRESIVDQLRPHSRRILEDSTLLDPVARQERRHVFNEMTMADVRTILGILNDDQRAYLRSLDSRIQVDRFPDRVLEEGKALRRFDTDEDAIVLGLHVSQGNVRQRDGTYQALQPYWMPSWPVTLTVVPISESGRPLDPRDRILPVVNEYQSGIYQIDERRVIVPLHVTQEMLNLDASTRTSPTEFDESGLPKVIGENPARATSIFVRASEGITPEVLKGAVVEAYEEVARNIVMEGEPIGLPALGLSAQAMTWEEQQASFIGPVEKERDLMRILFMIVYIVCAGLVLVIFWAIVFEKTRDIGILRSIGASRLGILWIFVRYGLFVGVVGAVLGLGLGWLVVWNINHIHMALGDPFPAWAWIGMFALAGVFCALLAWKSIEGNALPVVVLGMLTIATLGIALWMNTHTGFLVWDPKVYYFTEIPNHIDLRSAIGTMVGAVLFSVVGALIPASRAADIDPVNALRYE